MSGHSKWNNIKHRKESGDLQKAKIFTKIGREIAIAVKEGGSDPKNNTKLRDIIAKARTNNMPNDSIQRSIKKAAGEGAAIAYEEVVYEGYAAGGVAIIVESLTDNRNRTASDVRHCFGKHGGSLGESGCVSWMFDKKGVIVIEADENIDEDELMMDSLEAGALDFVKDGEVYEVYTQAQDFSTVRDYLENKGYKFASAQIEWIPNNTLQVEGETAEKLEKLIESLDDLDDIQNVYHNGEMD
jgi:YebC/PmpR family DNA-binding regulatory protein